MKRSPKTAIQLVISLSTGLAVVAALGNPVQADGCSTLQSEYLKLRIQFDALKNGIIMSDAELEKAYRALTDQKNPLKRFLRKLPR